MASEPSGKQAEGRQAAKCGMQERTRSKRSGLPTFVGSLATLCGLPAVRLACRNAACLTYVLACLPQSGSPLPFRLAANAWILRDRLAAAPLSSAASLLRM